jgi:putative endonuclease
MVLSEHQRVEGLRFMIHFVYILRTSSNELYIGVTKGLAQRLATHNCGKGAKWIKTHGNAELVYPELHPTLAAARKREIQVKKWSRAKKEALSAGDIAMLKDLSRCHSGKDSQTLGYKIK